MMLQPITKLDFLNGKSFIYSGSFMRFTQFPLSYHLEANEVYDKQEEYKYTVREIHDDKVIVFNKAFGIIPIFFKNCKLEPIKDAHN